MKEVIAYLHSLFSPRACIVFIHLSLPKGLKDVFHVKFKIELEFRSLTNVKCSLNTLFAINCHNFAVSVDIPLERTSKLLRSGFYYPLVRMKVEK